MAVIRPMLATTGELPREPGWGYEFKWDGVRALADISAGQLRLWARSGVEITVAYPELAPLASAPVGGATTQLDGELVVLRDGRPSFTLLAERMHVRDPARAARLAASLPVTYMIFDLLRLDGQDLARRSYVERRTALEALGLAGARYAVPPMFLNGPDTYAAAEESGLEGVVAKRLESSYLPGLRSPDWIKVKLDLTGDFVIGGWRPGVRQIGGLLVGVPDDTGRLQFRGRVGGGISAAAERELLAVLEPLRTTSSSFAAGSVPRPDAKGAKWVRPEMVVEVKYGQRTPDNRLRFPRYLRLRPDKTAAECREEGSDGAGG